MPSTADLRGCLCGLFYRTPFTHSCLQGWRGPWLPNFCAARVPQTNYPVRHQAGNEALAEGCGTVFSEKCHCGGFDSSVATVMGFPLFNI